MIPRLPAQLAKVHEHAALAETEIREAVAGEMEDLLRDMEASYKARSWPMCLHVREGGERADSLQR